MNRLNIVRQKDVTNFIQTHPTFFDGIKIPDGDAERHFNKPLTQEIKSKFWNYYHISLPLLLDEMDRGFDYLVALNIIKQNGFGLPLRVKGWGYEEPLTVDELEDHLQKQANRWNRVFNNALERLNKIKLKREILQTKIL